MGRGAQSGGTKVLRMRLHRNGATAIVRDIRGEREIICARGKKKTRFAGANRVFEMPSCLN
jgi:hypothetical protein